MKNIPTLMISSLCLLTACGPGEALNFVKDAAVDKFHRMKNDVDYACDQDTLNDLKANPRKYSTEEGRALIAKMRIPELRCKALYRAGKYQLDCEMDRQRLSGIIDEFQQAIDLLSGSEEKASQKLHLAYLSYYDEPTETLQFVEQLKASIYKLDPSDVKCRLLGKIAKFQIRVQRPTDEVEKTIRALEQANVQLYYPEDEFISAEDWIQKSEKQGIDNLAIRKQFRRVLQLQKHQIEQDRKLLAEVKSGQKNYETLEAIQPIFMMKTPGLKCKALNHITFHNDHHRALDDIISEFDLAIQMLPSNDDKILHQLRFARANHWNRDESIALVKSLLPRIELIKAPILKGWCLLELGRFQFKAEVDPEEVDQTLGQVNQLLLSIDPNERIARELDCWSDNIQSYKFYFTNTNGHRGGQI